MSAAPGSEGGRAAGVHLEVEGDDHWKRPAPSTRPPTASNEPGDACAASERCTLQPHLLDSSSYGLDPCFHVRGRRFRARFPAHSRCERPFLPWRIQVANA
jgi:hypothetical protein